jgi:hypothetical protein
MKTAKCPFCKDKIEIRLSEPLHVKALHSDLSPEIECIYNHIINGECKQHQMYKIYINCPVCGKEFWDYGTGIDRVFTPSPGSCELKFSLHWQVYGKMRKKEHLTCALLGEGC